LNISILISIKTTHHCGLDLCRLFPSPVPCLTCEPDATTYAHFLFNAFDKDRNGSIRFEDFVIGLSVLLRGSVTEKLNWAFNLYDINKDGYITKEVHRAWPECVRRLVCENEYWPYEKLIKDRVVAVLLPQITGLVWGSDKDTGSRQTESPVYCKRVQVK